MRGRRVGIVVAALALTGTVALAGAAGAATSQKAKPLSKKAYIKAADNICRQGDQLVNQAGQDAFGGLRSGEQPSAAQLQSFVDHGGSAFQQEVDSLRALPAPTADAKKLKRLYQLVQKGFDQLLADPILVLEGPKPKAIADASKQAKAYGFKVCGQSG
jgi:hypothetical protein